MINQVFIAEEQPFSSDGMDFAFDDAQVSSVEMSELSGSEMDETEGGLVAALYGRCRCYCWWLYVCSDFT